MPALTVRDAAREAARAHLAVLFPDHGLTPDVAEGIADVVLDRVAVLIRAACFTHTPDAEHGWITCHCDVADELHRHPLAPGPTGTPERHRDLPPGEFGDLVRKITPSSQEQRHA